MREPAPQPYAVGPPSDLAPRVPEGLAVAALVLACVYAALEVLFFLASFGAAEAYGEAARQGTEAMDVFTTYDALGIAYVVLLPLWIVSSVFLRRVRACAAAAAPGVTHERGPVWTWLGWVVPVVCLWFPYQVVRDIVRHAWRDPWGDQRQGLHLGLWWAAWIVALVASQVASWSIPWSGVPDAAAVARLPLLHGITVVATVIGLVLWVRIVNSLLHALKTTPEVMDVILTRHVTDQ